MKKSIVLALVFLGTLFQQGANAQFTQEAQNAASKFGSLLGQISMYYVDSVDESELVETAIISMLEDLDPHSMYISVEDLKAMNEPLEGKFEGIGIQFNILRDTILVVSPISGGPSEKLGILSGDKIVTIEGKTVAGIGITNKDVTDQLRGDKGTEVTVGIYRSGEPELLDFTITRDKIPIFSVDASYMARPGVGYIKLNRFSKTSMMEIRQGMDSLYDAGMESLILDLRGNGGGYLKTAWQLADEFLEDDKMVVYTEGRSSPKDEMRATMFGGFQKGKLIILIDEGSASASEIVSGAVQDWDRGLIIGRRSFGKGLVQKPFTLPDGSQVRLTVSRYYTPSGKCIQRNYEDGSDAYRHEMQRRLDHGELVNQDSIAIPDSLKFTTHGGRTVYGGGGIMPDIFIPIDTTLNTEFYRTLIRKGAFNEFYLTYTNQHREELLEKYPTLDLYMESFEVDQQLFDDLIAFGETKGIERDEEKIKESEEFIKNQLKALIAKRLWNSSAYYRVINESSPAYQKALEVMSMKSFKEFGIK